MGGFGGDGFGEMRILKSLLESLIGGRRIIKIFIINYTVPK